MKTYRKNLNQKTRRETIKRLSKFAPVLDGRAVLEIVEAKIRSGNHLGQHDDLTGVHREVFCYVEDGFKQIDVVTLNLAAIQ